MPFADGDVARARDADSLRAANLRGDRSSGVVGAQGHPHLCVVNVWHLGKEGWEGYGKAYRDAGGAVERGQAVKAAGAALCAETPPRCCHCSLPLGDYALPCLQQWRCHARWLLMAHRLLLTERGWRAMEEERRGCCQYSRHYATL